MVRYHRLTMKTLHRGIAGVGLAALAVLLNPPALRADPLLTPAYAAQVESWLNQGDLDFTNIFTKVQGDGQDSASFHAAADYHGPTITLMSTYALSPDYPSPTYPNQIIGGYNPQSWDTAGDHWVWSDAGRTAFLFNLASNQCLWQQLGGAQSPADLDHMGSSDGLQQTVNQLGLGPTWGFGYDLTANGSLEAGSAHYWGYGQHSGPITGLFDPVEFLDQQVPFRIASIEIYTFTPAAPVSEAASTAGMLGMAAFGLMLLRRRGL